MPRPTDDAYEDGWKLFMHGQPMPEPIETAEDRARRAGWRNARAHTRRQEKAS